jgi:hypothetical protein
MEYVDIAMPDGKSFHVPTTIASTYQNIANSARTLFNDFVPTRPYNTGYDYEQVGEHEWLIKKMDDKPHFWVSCERRPDGSIFSQCEAIATTEEGIIPIGPCPSQSRWGTCKHVQAIVLACLEKRSVP